MHRWGTPHQVAGALTARHTSGIKEDSMGPSMELDYILAREHQADLRSEEHTSELQSQSNLVCRLLLEKKNNSHRLLLCFFTFLTFKFHTLDFVFQFAVMFSTQDRFIYFVLRFDSNRYLIFHTRSQLQL